VIPLDPGLADQPLQQISAKACGMIDGQPDVLVKVEHLHASPVERQCGERVEEIELRCTGGGDNAREASCPDRSLDRLACPARSSAVRRSM